MLKYNVKRYAVLVLALAMLLALCSCVGSEKVTKLDSWSEDSSNKKLIIDFVKAVTDKNSKDYVPVEDRIATFDMDGTLACEEPLWFELAVAEYWIMNDMKDNKELVEEVNKLNENLKKNPEPPETGKLIDDVTGKAFLNMSQEDFVAYMEKFMDIERSDFEGLKYKDTFYKPMVELVKYLIENDFQVYVVSGSERGVIWGACKEALPMLPRSRMIGADIALKPTNQSNPEDSSYVFRKDDQLLRQLGFTQKDLKMWKVYNIYHQIGKKPILAFGNTDGDFSMLNYAKSNNYKSAAFLLCHDDDVREYNYNIQQRNEWNSTAKANDWNVVYMSKDFKQVFMKETKKK